MSVVPRVHDGVELAARPVVFLVAHVHEVEGGRVELLVRVDVGPVLPVCE